jgi:DNA-binding transcriptional MocR family regulator
MPMLKGEDIVVLLRLMAGSPSWTVRSLEAEIAIPRSVIQRSLVRLEQAGLLEGRRRRVNVGRAEELLVHAVKYMFPPVRGGETRGVPTAWAAPPLRDKLADSGELPPVWPDPMGSARGIALEPLHGSAPEISRRDPALSELLMLTDGLRAGDARVRGIAEELLRARLGSAAAA